jgi:hypothetical protein
MCVFRYSTNADVSLINENKNPQLCHTSRDVTRAGFESSTVNASLKNLGPYLSRYGLIPLPVTVIQTKREFSYLNKKTRAFERACTVSQ